MFISFHDEGTPEAQVNTATIRPDGTDLRWLTNYPRLAGLRAVRSTGRQWRVCSTLLRRTPA